MVNSFCHGWHVRSRIVSSWSSDTSIGEAGNSETFSSVARSYLYSFLTVVPLEVGGLSSKRVWLRGVKPDVPVEVRVICGEGQ